ncbi:MAG: ABC transporter permease [Candidatus Firestonebacteria bacterium]
MNYLESAKIPFTNLKANKMRTLLTMLGVIIGVMSIILLVSVVTGTRAKVESEMKSMGSNAFMVFPGNLEETHGPPGSFSVNKLKMKYVELFESRSTCGVKASPVFIIMGETVKYKRESRNTTMVGGVTPNFTYVRNWNVSSGNFFRKEDVDSARKVCVVGTTIVNDFFKESNPIGKEITVVGKKFLVIGVVESKGNFFGKDMDDFVAIPITTAHELLGSTTINQIILKVPDPNNLDKAINETKRILEKDMDKEDFTVSSQGEMLSMFNTFADVLSVVMGCVAGISLFVGGIGIMNIMLVAVRERTREIGIRKAVGASFYDILFQFIVEAIIIAVIGGLIGIVLAILIITIVSPFVPLPLSASLTAIIVSFTFSSLVGVFFGTYPALRAARVDPIVALRYE